jgi:hypothetical protein
MAWQPLHFKAKSVNKMSIKNIHSVFLNRFLEHRIVQSVLAHPWLSSIAFLVFFLLLIETALIHRKSGLFGRGFLQFYAVDSVFEGVLFVFWSLIVDSILIGAIGAVFYFVTVVWNRHHLVSAYNFFISAIYLFGITLFAKYKVLEYFSDTINFQIIQNLGGGSVRQAVSYAADEVSILIIVAVILGAYYFLGLFYIKRYVVSHPALSLEYKSESFSFKHSGFLLVVLSISTGVLLVMMTLQDDVRYGLSRKYSYKLLTNLYDNLTDWDRDGIGYYSFPPDNEPFDSEIYPGALDVPFNGVDEDGMGGDFHYKEEDKTRFLRSAVIGESRRHIIFVVIESARYDLFEKKIDDRFVAPNIRNLASTGHKIEYAYSHTGYTATSLKAIFNGTLSLSKADQSLFDYFRTLGYKISVYSGQDETFSDIENITNMRANADYFFDAGNAIDERVFGNASPASLKISVDRVVDELVRVTAEDDWEKPNFIYMNFQSAHFPYYHDGMPLELVDVPLARGEIGKSERDRLERTYWNAIAYADFGIGRITDWLETQEIKDFVLVVLGDHGESLYDDGYLGHGHQLNEIQTRIPIVLNRSIRNYPQPLGQIHLQRMFLNLATAEPDTDGTLELQNSSDHSVFQYVGTLDNPVLVGLVLKDEQRVILDFRTRLVYFSSEKEQVPLKKAIENGIYNEVVNKLIYLWEKARWEEYVSKKRKAEMN